MPVFQITAPDGRKFRVTGPEGSTKEQALAQVQQQAERPQSAEAPASPTDGATFGENFSAGVGKSFVDTGRGIGQLIAGIGAKVMPSVYQPIADNIQAGVDEATRLDAPLMATGGGITGNIAGQAAQFAIPGSAVAGGGLKLLPRLARGAAAGAAIANTQPVTGEQTRLGNTAFGAAGGAAGEGIAAGIGRLAAGSSNKISPEVRALAKRAKDLGIPLRAEQVSGSRPLAGVSAALDAVPFSGRDASRDTQRLAFNRAVSRTFGQNTANLKTAVDQAENVLGAKYDAVLKNHGVNVDNQMLTDLQSVASAARNEMTDAQFSVIQRNIDNIIGKVGPNNQIDAEAAYNIKKLLDRIGKSSDSSLANHARDLRSVVIQALDRSLPPDVARGFTETRAQYKNLIDVRKLVKAGAEGNVSPAVLGNKSGLSPKLKEIADIGAQFLKEPFGNSGTQNRTVGLGILGGLGAGAMFNPALAIQTAAGGATIGRGANALLQSPGFVNYQLAGSNTLRRSLPYANALLPAFGATGAVASQ
jgi:hypothetical protein